MSPAKESRNIAYLDHMALLGQGRNYIVPFFPPSKLTANLATFQDQFDSKYFHGPSTSHENAADRILKPMPQNCNISYLNENQLTRDNLYAPQKRFLIFDQSGDGAKLFFSPSFLPQNHISAASIPSSAKGLFAEMAAGANPGFPKNPTFEEKWDENHLTDGEGEHDVLEDTEEIDALFYSDSYEDIDDDVASTGHSPITIQDKLLDEPIEQVVDSNDSQKRRKLLDGKFEKSRSTTSQSDGNPCGDYFDSGKREKKVNIHRALEILESIIPYLDEKDPLSVINKAIAYLKILRTEAEALGVC